MPPELLDSIWALALWLLLVVLFPKRGLVSLRDRIAAVAAGRRLHVFGPLLLSRQREDLKIRLCPLVPAEAHRVLEMGVPLWLVSVIAEVLGTAHRHEMEAGWNRSPSGLMAEHLLGQLSRRDLHRKLSELGLPTPAPKAQRTVRRAFTTPPMAWLREGPTVSLDGYQSDAAAGPQVPPLPQPKLDVQTLGTLRVAFDGEDLTAKLLKRPSIAFMWQYGLVRAICAPDIPTSREWLADELYAGYDLDTQRGRLRKQLYNLQQVLQGPLVGPIKIESGNLLFDLSACTIDVAQVLELARRCEAAQGLLPPATVAQVSASLASANEEFLPDWEDLEQSVTGGHGTAGDSFRELRRRIEAAKISLLVALGDHYLAVRDPARAATALEEAFALQPERPNLVRKLADALDGSGQHARAQQIRRGDIGWDASSG
jgi:DNA-binding SARP family transcriptional activator